MKTSVEGRYNKCHVEYSKDTRCMLHQLGASCQQTCEDNTNVKRSNAQAIAIWEEYNKSVMNNFPQLSNTDIDNILAYTDYVPPPTVAAVSNIPAQPVQDNSVSNQLILFALVLIFTILLTMFADNCS